MDQTPTTTPGDSVTGAHAAEPQPDVAGPVEQPAHAADAGAPAATPAGAAPAEEEAQSFRTRGRMRRRARFLRKARELAYRDLGGLVFNLHRFGQRNDDLVLAKLNLLAQMDNELRALEHALRERHPITVLREAGVTACPRCAAIHASEDRFCPRCGLSLGRHPDLPIATAGAEVPASPPAPVQPAAGSAPGPEQPPSAPAQQSPVAPAGGDGTRPPAAPASGAPPVAAPSGAGVHKAESTPESVTEIIRPPVDGQ